MNAEAVMTALLSAALLGSVPLMLAAVGEAIGERAGLLNLGVEGVMLIGGFTGFWVALRGESLLLGLCAGALAGLLVGSIFGVLTVAAKADQVVLGLGVTLVGGGVTGFLFRESFGSSQPLLDTTMGRPLAGLGDWVPIVGPAVFGQVWFVYLAWGIVLGCDLMLRSSTFGLRLRAVGEAPFAVDATGISVDGVRIAAAMIGGTLAGLAGAALTIVELGFFRPGVTLGIGFIAIALAMLGQLTPWRIAAAAMLFGLLRGLDAGLQLTSVKVRAEFLQMLPYLGVVIALIIVGRNIRLPAALGRAYVRGRSRGDL
ncbi:MAG: ABC transporter permease [Thermomicrobiales bacterium]